MKAISQEEYMKTCCTICCLLFAVFLAAQPIDMSVPADSLDKILKENLKRYHQYQPAPLYEFEVAIPGYMLWGTGYQSGYLDYQYWTDYEMYQVGREWYDTYYRKDILIWSYRQSVFVSVNLKDMQNSQGLLRFRIPLPNFSGMSQRRREKIVYDREEFQWHYLN
ncbi:MAG: hypothetical protein CVU48_00820 [Candidatus Cloacimonetes bacterium HGW-Cloacimonetes-1]|jgi:hypothetical protein|nr:MAG: hypothetical protein CVU48_00820 [Candidatus Cloacimonetes bacterium HGW-Cloacimonetes-1]